MISTLLVALVALLAAARLGGALAERLVLEGVPFQKLLPDGARLEDLLTPPLLRWRLTRPRALAVGQAAVPVDGT
jgi:hypothetical protein